MTVVGNAVAMVAAFCLTAGFTTVIAQPLGGPPAVPGLKYSTPMPSGVASPDKVETRLGTLNLFDGFPDKASVGSQTRGLLVNAGGSTDVFFGPRATAGKELNWVQTVPGQAWNTILRLYGPLDPWFNKTWRPGEIEMHP